MIIGNNIGVEGCRMISEILKKDSRLVELNLLGKKKKKDKKWINLKCFWEKKVTG